MFKYFILLTLCSYALAELPKTICTLKLHNKEYKLLKSTTEPLSKQIGNILSKNYCIKTQRNGTCWLAATQSMVSKFHQDKGLETEILYQDLAFTHFVNRVSELDIDTGIRAKLWMLPRSEKKHNAFENLIYSISSGGEVDHHLEIENFYIISSIPKSKWEAISLELSNVLKEMSSLKLTFNKDKKIELSRLFVQKLKELLKDVKTVKNLIKKENIININIGSIDKAINKGYSVFLGVESTQSSSLLYNSTSGEIKRVAESKSLNHLTSGLPHAMEVVGYLKDNDGYITHYMIANSWGNDKGLQGFYHIKKTDLIPGTDLAYYIR